MTPSARHPQAIYEAGHPRPGLHARLRRVSDVTPRTVLRTAFTLPVVIGDEFTIEEEALWEEFDTVSAGRFAQAAAGKLGQALSTFTSESLTMTWDPKWMVAPGQQPEKVLRTLRKILHERAVFDLLIVNKPSADFAEFAGYATIRRLAIVLKRGEPDTRYLQMDLSSHRRMSSRRRRHGRASNLPTTATLDANDTLRSLASHYYGTGELWRLIAKANGIDSWGSEDPLVKMGRYKVGDRIKIPERPHRGPPNGGTTADTQGLIGDAVEVG
jgi:hypothetical protein